MCYSYILRAEEDDIYKRYGISQKTISIPSETQAFPGSLMPVVVRKSPNSIVMMQWGLVPSWAKDPAIGKKMFNARSETVANKPAFRKAFRSQRCLIPASGFFEWGTDEKEKKQQFLFQKEQESIFSLAGLYEEWMDAEARALQTFTMITTTPNAVVRSVHDRMPVMLQENEEEIWLDGDTPPEKLQDLVVSKTISTLRVDPVPEKR